MKRINLYQTPKHDCPYLPDQFAVTQFIDPQKLPDKQMYSYLSQQGFRRSGEHLYRPNCPSCNACVPIRIPVNEIILSKSQLRCLKRAEHLDFVDLKVIDSDEHYQLYEKYINCRHKDGDMYPPTRKLFNSFLLSGWADTQFLEIRYNSRLIASAVHDQLNGSLSAVYCYFDPEFSKLSLGKLAILKQIQYAKEQQLQYLYLGYQIDQCSKMSYKNNYHPVEQFLTNQWQRFE